jgi:acetyl-CoA carboxylase biotin carboxyl carrier protein
MNIKEIKQMIDLMNENNLMELEIEREGMRIKLKKTATGDIQAQPVIIEKEITHKKLSSPVTEEPQPPLIKTVEIKAPMVGTFYRAPNPEAAPYVEVGQVIEPGEVICIIEAMKLMNEIKSEIKGRITEILVENAEPVEFSQSLFLVEPL